MRAVIYDQFGGPLRVESVADPTPAPDGVVVAVHATGLCRSDWHGWQGHDPDIARLPHVPGHEFAGVVVETGPQVERFRVGDYVTAPFVAGCGQCVPCGAGHPQVCDRQYQPGFTGWGTFAEAVALRYADHNLIRLPDHLDPASAASLGCRLGTAYRAVAEVGRVASGDWVAVYGCGGLGLSAIQVAAALQARVIAIDPRPAALRLASELGAAATVDGAGDAVAEQVVEIADRRGVDVGIDAAGNIVAAANSIRSLRKRGCHVQVGLLSGDGQQQALPMELVIARELRILGSHGIAAASYGKLLQLVSSGAIDPARLVGRTIGLAEAPQAMIDFEQASGPGITIIHMNLAN